MEAAGALVRAIVATLGPLGTGIAAAVLTLVIWFMRWSPIRTPYTLTLPADLAEKDKHVDFPDYKLEGPVMVTGGAGFLGSHIVDALRRQPNHLRIVVFDLADYKPPSNSNVVYEKGDLTKPETIAQAIAKHAVKLVIHVASPDNNCPDINILRKVNVDGSRNLVTECQKAGVNALVYTSSASVVWQGVGQEGVDEACPYPTAFRDPYAWSKAEAEKLIMAAGAASKAAGKGLATVCVRPHSIFGERDPYMLPTLVPLVKRGGIGSKVTIGDGRNVVDWTYVGNVVHGHLLAASVAQKQGAVSPCNGRTYFITNGQPMRFWEFMAWMLIGLGYEPFKYRLPYALILGIAKAAGAVVALVDATCRRGQRKTQLTLSAPRLQISGTSHWYSIDAARKDLGYQPVWDLKHAVFRTLRHFQSKRNDAMTPAALDRARAGNLVALKLIPDIVAAKAIKASSEGLELGANQAFKDEASLPFYTRAEVAKHASVEDLWVVVGDKVYDFSAYVKPHPGGIKEISQHAGGDATVGFTGAQHPAHVFDTARKFLVGKLAPTETPVPITRKL